MLRGNDIAPDTGFFGRNKQYSKVLEASGLTRTTTLKPAFNTYDELYRTINGFLIKSLNTPIIIGEAFWAKIRRIIVEANVWSDTNHALFI